MSDPSQWPPQQPIPQQQPGHAQPAPQPQVAVQSKVAAAQAPIQAGLVNTAPQVAPAAAPSTSPMSNQILASLSDRIPDVDRTDGYLTGVLFIALILVMLPLLYSLGLILSAAGMAFSVMYFSPIGMFIFGVVLLLLGFVGLALLKPIFAPAGDYHPPIKLDPQDEPLLFEFVQRLCDVVGAPMPSEIQVDTDVNASASMGHGLMGILLRRNLVLTIGLPLAAGLPLRQLTGIIAHELGHFTQSSGMRLSALIRFVNHWFTIAVLHRDGWDEGLARASEFGGIVTAFAQFIRLGVFISRYGLWWTRVFIDMIICRLMREMEYDADLHEMRVTGSNVFELTSMNLHALTHGWETAHADLFQAWHDRRLSDDLPAMVVAKVDQMRQDPKLVAKIKAKIQEQDTEWFMTHPSTPQRIEAARRENAPGVFHLDAPARELFSDFDGLCKFATAYYYRTEIGPEVTTQNLVATSTIVDEQKELDEAFETLDRYFQGKILGTHEVFLPKDLLVVPQNPKETAELLKHSRQRMVDHLMDTDQASRHYEIAVDRVHELHKLQIVLNAGFLFNPAEYRLPDASAWAVQNALQQAEVQRSNSRENFLELLRDAQNRLVAGLQLLHVPKVAARVQNAAESQKKCQTMLATLMTLETVWPTVNDLIEVSSALHLLLSIVESTEVDYQLYQQVISINGEAVNRIGWIRSQMSMRRYPFEHAHGQVSIADYALPTLPPPDDIGEVMMSSEMMLVRLNNLYQRVFVHLVKIAEQVEAVFGYEPLPKPPEQSTDNWWQTDLAVEQ